MFGTLLLLLVVALSLGYLLFRRSIRHLKIIDEMFPGPVGVPVLGSAFEMLVSSEEFYKQVTKFGNLYRRSFRIWLANRVFIGIIDAKEAEIVLSSNVCIDKSEIYDFLLPWIGDGLLNSSGQKWRKHRKMLTPAFHFKILGSFVDVFNQNGDILVDKLRQLEKDEVINIMEYIKLYALDNICESAMGTKLDAQKSPNSTYVQSIKSICNVAFRRSITVWLRSDFIFHLTKYGAMQRRALKVIHGTTNDVIKRRKAEFKNRTRKGLSDDDDFNEKDKLVFLDILLSVAEENNLTDEEIREEVDTFMFEGHDTVTSGISFALYNLAHNPDVQQGEDPQKSSAADPHVHSRDQSRHQSHQKSAQNHRDANSKSHRRSDGMPGAYSDDNRNYNIEIFSTDE